MRQVTVIPANISSTSSQFSISPGRFDYKSVLKAAFKPHIGNFLC